MSMFRAVTLIAVLVAVAACGNRTDQGAFLKSARSGALKKAGQGSTASPAEVAAAVKASLAATDAPLALVALEGRKATSILTRIEQNGAYETWATPDRRSITMRGGIVTATRGLGNDMMSSSLGQSLALISGRKAGTATRAMRFLDGENHTVELVLSCDYARGGGKRLSAGELSNVATTQMTETCAAGTTQFTNSYLVDGRGRIVHSRQWLSPTSGHMLIQPLR